MPSITASQVPGPFPRNQVDYLDIRSTIRDGDLLLMRPSTLAGREICLWTRCEYSHAAMVACWFGRLLVLQMLPWEGGAPDRLSRLVDRYPGWIDVWRPEYRRPHSDPWEAVGHMIDLVHAPYGWADLAHDVTRRLFPWACDHQMYVSPPGRSLVCSAAVANALRHVHVDPAPGKPVWAIEPGELTRVSRYLFTLGVAA